MIKSIGNNPDTCGFSISESSIPFYRLMLLKTQLESELNGLRFGNSAYAIIKKEFDLKGSRQKVYDQFVEIFDKKQQEHQELQEREVIEIVMKGLKEEGAV
jgi:hypothetical protein